MSKELLINELESINHQEYSWSLYFLKIDKRASNPFKIHKVKFRKEEYLKQYAQNSIKAILGFQITPLSEVELYNGENTKVSCDKLQLDSELISQQWKNLESAVAQSSSSKIQGKVHGYILEGNSNSGDADSLICVKSANPIANLKTKKTVIFTSTEDELDIIADNAYRLYLTTDFIVWSKKMYAFNHSFEKMFGLEETMKKVKSEAIETITNTGCFVDAEKFKALASGYSSNRTFISLNDERVNKLSTVEGREYISLILGIGLNEEGLLDDLEQEESNMLIQYLCFRIVKDDESKQLIKVSNAKKMETTLV